MNEIPNVLEPNEKIIWNGKPKYSAFMASALIGGLSKRKESLYK